MTKLLHRTEDLSGEEADAWDKDDDAMEEATCKLQVVYGMGAENKSYKELLRAKPKAKIPTSRVITLKAEEVVSTLFILYFMVGLKHNNSVCLGQLLKVQSFWEK